MNDCFFCKFTVDKENGVRCELCGDVICKTCNVCGCFDVFSPTFLKENERIYPKYTNKEFTCLCPFTGQPDYAEVTIDIACNATSRLPELKSLKMFFNTFRDKKISHEELTIVLRRIMERMLGNTVDVVIKFSPRGGITTEVLA